ncbi:ubiquitin specific protease 47 isoform X2 [Calliopsis andreniformis]
MTCYLNSLLQALYMTPEFRNALYNWEYINGSEKDEANSIPYQLQKLFLNLQTSTKSAVETTELTKSFGWDSTEAWQQHDIQELCRVMFDALEQKFKNTEQADLINRLYEGKMIDYVKCLECGTEKSREDTFLDIPLPVRPFGSNVAYNSVEEALRAFVQYEILEGNNQYYCEKCNKKCDAHKGLKFTKFPYFLTLHLKRFDFDFQTFHRIKLNDKVTFPDILNLNPFVLSTLNEESPTGDENISLEKCDDSSTTNSSTLDDDYPLCENSLPNSSYSANYNQDDDHDEGVDMSNNHSTSNCTAHNYENKKNRNSHETKGPYNYELFSIMIHSGSASGGHYYAYIKDFRTGEWLCFNDQSVTPITQDHIQRTYGGGASRPYYGGAYSSTNAYMLMYRQIDPERNILPMQVHEFPKHIQELLKKMKDDNMEVSHIVDNNFEDSDSCRKRVVFRRSRISRKEIFTKKINLTVFCWHPTENKRMSHALDLTTDTTLEQATKICYIQFLSASIVSLDQCRLVSYNQNSDTIIRSYEGQEKELLSKLLSKMTEKVLLLEVRDKEKKFESYQGDILTKVNIVDVPKRKLLERIEVRASWTQTVREYKEMVGKIVNMDPDEMKLVLQTERLDIVPVINDDADLRTAKFTDCFNVYISTMFDTECKFFYHSAMYAIINNFKYILTIYIELPDTSPEILEELNIPLLDEKYEDKEKAVAASSPPKTSLNETQNDNGFKCNQVSKNGKDNLRQFEQFEKTKEATPVRNISPQLGEGEEWNTSEQSNSEDSSLSDSDKTLVGDAPEDDDDLQVPYLSLNTNNRANVMLNQIKPENLDDVDKSKHYFNATPYDKYLLVHVDRRMRFDVFKKKLEPYVGVPVDYFKIRPLYLDHGEAEDFPFQTLLRYKDGQKFQILLDATENLHRTIEHKISLYQFIIDASWTTEPQYKFLCDWVVTKDTTVSEAKKDILEELKRQFDIDIPYERLRLRQRYFSMPSKILLDDQKFDHLLNCSRKPELLVQELPEKEPVTNSNQVVVFVRRWYPSKREIEPMKEVVMDGRSVEEMKKKLSEISGIPEKYLEIARIKRYLQYGVPVRRIQYEPGWDEHLFDTELDINDCSVYCYKDAREIVCTAYNAHRKILLHERNLLPSSSMARDSKRKERALRIQWDTE